MHEQSSLQRSDAALGNDGARETQSQLDVMECPGAHAKADTSGKAKPLIQSAVELTVALCTSLFRFDDCTTVVQDDKRKAGFI